MTTEFPFVNVPLEFYPVVGDPIPGAQEESSYWFDFLCEKYDRLVSPGGVSMFAPVSRAAVHKRMKEGRLTCFLYDVKFRKRNLFGITKEVRERDMAMIPVSECKAWGREIEDRAIEQGRVTREELEGDKPDWDGLFMHPDSRWEKQQKRKAQKS